MAALLTVQWSSFNMQLYQMLRLTTAVAVLLKLSVAEELDSRSQGSATSARNIVDSDKGAQYSVYFIPAYRLTANKTLRASPAHPHPPLSQDQRRRPIALDPRSISARLVTAALGAVVRNVTAAQEASKAAQLASRASQEERDPPPQRHDAHILVTVQKAPQYGPGAPVAVVAPTHGVLVGHGTSHHFNNYPAVPNHVPAHYGIANLPQYQYGYLPTPVSQPSQVSVAASASDVVASPAVSVSPGTLLGTTGPLYASPGSPVSTYKHLPTTSTTTSTPSTTVIPSTSSASFDTTSESESNKEDIKSERIGDLVGRNHTEKNNYFNPNEQIEVINRESRSDENSSSEESTTRSPHVQQTSPSTATETIDLNKPPPQTQPTPPQPQPTPRTELPAPPPSFLPYPNPVGFQNGFALAGYIPAGYDPRYTPAAAVPNRNVAQSGNDPYNGPLRFPYRPHPSDLPVAGRYNPAERGRGQFYDHHGYIPGFAPGYPFGVPADDYRDTSYIRPNQPRKPEYTFNRAAGVYHNYPVQPTGGGIDDGSSQEKPDNRPASEKSQVGSSSPNEASRGGFSRQPVAVYSNVPYGNAIFDPQTQRQQLYPHNHQLQQYPPYLQQPYRYPEEIPQPNEAQVQGPQQQVPHQQHHHQQQQQLVQAGAGLGFTTSNPNFRLFHQPTQTVGLDPRYSQHTDQFLSPGRGHPYYEGPAPTHLTQKAVGGENRGQNSEAGLGELPSPFNSQQYRSPFEFSVNPFISSASDRSEPEARQSQVTPFRTVGPSFSSRKQVSSTHEAKDKALVDDLLGSVVRAITKVSTRKLRRRDLSQHNHEYGGPRR